MAFGGDIGVTIDAAALGKGSVVSRLFSEGPSRWLAEVSPEHRDAVEERFGTDATLVGRTGGRTLSIVDEEEVLFEQPLDALRKKWQSPLWERMG